MTGTLQLTRLATLDIAAASGAVLHDDLLWVIADDGHALHRYTLRGDPLAPLPLFAERAPLPSEPRARKKQKPDLEALVQLPDGSLLALGSGSAANRREARHVFPGNGGDRVAAIDLSPLYAALAAVLPDLNIEGAVVRGDHLVLAQRGNGRGGNALVVLDLAQAMADLSRGMLGATGMKNVAALSLGELGGVALTPTDLATGPDGVLWYIAAAEDTDNPYEDGACAGSVIGRLDNALRVERQWQLAPALKVEGLHFHRRDDAGDHWLLVADADSPATPAPLLALLVP